MALNSLREVTLLISLILVLNFKSFHSTSSIAEIQIDSKIDDYNFASKDVNREVYPTSTNYTSIAPKGNFRSSSLGLFAGVVALIAISVLIARCLRNMLSSAYGKPSRRLAPAPHRECTEDNPSPDTFDGTSSSPDTSPQKDSSPSVSSPTTILLNRDGDMEWQKKISNQIDELIHKTQYPFNFDPNAISMVVGKRFYLWEFIIKPILPKIDRTEILSSTRELLTKVKAFQSKFGLEGSQVHCILQGILDGKTVLLYRDENYVLAFQKAMKNQSEKVEAGDGKFVKDCEEQVFHLVAANNEAQALYKKVADWIRVIKLRDIQLLRVDLSREPFEILRFQ